MQNKPLFIRVEWDEEAQVWVATSKKEIIQPHFH